MWGIRTAAAESQRMTGEKKKLTLAVVMLVAAVGVYFYFNSGGEVLSSNVPMVCVETGERFSIDRDDILYNPWINPKTERETLLPVEERDGKWYINDHSSSIIREDEFIKKVNKYVDPGTLEVRSPQ